jgi:H+/Cl- antiporter ClcA
MASFLSNLCTPAFVHLVIGIITLLLGIGYGMGIFAIIADIILILIGTWFLNYLCTKDLKGLSWFLVILPFIFLFVSLLLEVDDARMNANSNENRYITTLAKGV